MPHYSVDVEIDLVLCAPLKFTFNRKMYRKSEVFHCFNNREDRTQINNSQFKQQLISLTEEVSSPKHGKRECI